MLSRTLRKLATVLVALVGASWAGTAAATPLYLTLETEPDVFADFTSVTYNATTDALSVSGFAETLASGGSNTISGGTYSISATVDSSGNLGAGGTITIGGTIAGLGFNSGTLLTGDLTAIGFPDGTSGPLEFTFDVTGGDAASLYSPSGYTGGTIVGSPNGFPGNWTGNFSTSYAGVSDTGIVPTPEPSSLLLLGFALLPLLRARR